MPNIYVRLPHYVVSFLRNRDENNPIAEGQPFRLELGDPALDDLMFRIEPNLGNYINLKCFSERQWEAMRQGKMLSFRDGLVLDKSRDVHQPLSMVEIYRSCNRDDLIKYEQSSTASISKGRVTSDPTPDLIPLPNSAYVEQYVPFRLPVTVVRNGREQRVRSDWYLPDANGFINELTKQFKAEFYRFIYLDRQYARQRHLKRGKRESIDRFMLRYDIRPGDREREQLKKLIGRSVQSRLYAFDADEDHGRWIRENDTPSPTELAAIKRCRPVFVHETGDTFPSLKAFAEHIGTTRQNVYDALRHGHRCHGLTIEYADLD